MVAPYRGKLYWFWGDTNRLLYPLGLFRTAGATSELPANGGLHPGEGVNFDYFVGDDGFARAMAEVDNPEGVVWVHGVCTVDSDEGERMVTHYARRPGLGDPYEQGIMVYNDEREIFEVAAVFPLEETWRMLQYHPMRFNDCGVEFLEFGSPYAATRVPARMEAVVDPGQYKSWSCVDLATGEPRRNADGALDWQWQDSPPITPKDELEWLAAGLIEADEAFYLPVDVEDSGRHVTLHSGSVYWNEYRQRWVMIAAEITFDDESPSLLGEVWYTEANSPQGPFEKAVRIVTHDKQTFYNPCQHPYFDDDGGRVIYFEGTYCNTFTNSPATQRYNYNQIMYRLDLSHPDIIAAFE